MCHIHSAVTIFGRFGAVSRPQAAPVINRNNCNQGNGSIVNKHENQLGMSSRAILSGSNVVTEAATVEQLLPKGV